jgi:hypothetical protein
MLAQPMVGILKLLLYNTNIKRMLYDGTGMNQLLLTMSMYPMMMVAVLGCEKVLISCLSPKLLYEWNANLLLLLLLPASVRDPLAISASNLA